MAENFSSSGSFDLVRRLPRQVRQRLEQSWAGAFYREFVCQIDQRAFAALYPGQKVPSTIPVPILVGLEALKSSFDWSDEELGNRFLFDLQVRYALGLYSLADRDLEWSAVYDCRRRLVRHKQTTGEDLVARAFEHFADEQVIAAELQLGRLWIDRTLIADNMLATIRLQWMVQVLQQIQRMLLPTDQRQYAAILAPYVSVTSRQYVHGLKNTEYLAHLRRVGQVMQQLIMDLGPAYANVQLYHTLQQAFEEHFVVEAAGLRLKTGDEFSAADLAFLDDEQAIHRESPVTSAVVADAVPPVNSPPAVKGLPGFEERPRTGDAYNGARKARITIPPKGYRDELIAIGIAILGIYLILEWPRFASLVLWGFLPIFSPRLASLLSMLLWWLRWPMPVLAVAFVIWRVAWRRRQASLVDRTCPECGGQMRRVPRVWWEYIFSASLPYSVGRYECQEPECEWSGFRCSHW